MDKEMAPHRNLVTKESDLQSTYLTMQHMFKYKSPHICERNEVSFLGPLSQLLDVMLQILPGRNACLAFGNMLLSFADWTHQILV